MEAAKTMDVPSGFHTLPSTLVGTESSLVGLSGCGGIDDPRRAGGAEVGGIIRWFDDDEELVVNWRPGGAVDVRRKIDDVERTVDGTVGLERGEVEAREVFLVVDPGRVDFGFFLFLLAEGFGVVDPEG